MVVLINSGPITQIRLLPMAEFDQQIHETKRTKSLRWMSPPGVPTFISLRLTV
jgi:hypothetical protein